MKRDLNKATFSLQELETSTFRSNLLVALKNLGVDLGSIQSSGVAVWGTITGTLSSQTDLQTALNAKQDLLTNSAGLAAALSDETGTGLAVFNNTPTFISPILGAATGTSLQLSGLTASQLLATDASKNLQSLTVATYPSLTEISYVKGVTSSIQTQLNNKEATLTKGNLTEATSSVLTINGGTGAVIGTGTSIQVKQASGSQAGYLSSTDWTTFNSKEPAISVLSLAKGGTNKNMTASAGAVAYSDSDSLELTAVGTSGQYLKSNGTSAPSWDTPTDSTIFANGQGNTATAAGVTNFGAFFGGTTSLLNNEAARQSLMTEAGTFSNFFLLTATSQPATGSYVFTARKNGSNQAITITIAAGSAAGTFSDTSNTFTVVQGDKTCYSALNNASSGAAQVTTNSITFTRS